ncbi:MAG: hypothetical protein ACLFQY_06670 [Desulfococcaceae bacterium]
MDNENLLAMSPRAVARRVGCVLQRHPDTLLNVYEAVLLGRKPHIGWTVSDADHQIVERVLDRMGLSAMAICAGSTKRCLTPFGSPAGSSTDPTGRMRWWILSTP